METWLPPLSKNDFSRYNDGKSNKERGVFYVTGNHDENSLWKGDFGTYCGWSIITNDNRFFLQKNAKCSRERRQNETAVGTGFKKEI